MKKTIAVSLVLLISGITGLLFADDGGPAGPATNIEARNTAAYWSAQAKPAAKAQSQAKAEPQVKVEPQVRQSAPGKTVFNSLSDYFGLLDKPFKRKGNKQSFGTATAEWLKGINKQ